ncbi:unnamed protein product [Linum tenue]|uniref:Uncharacterized protein n=1 Tax=Linum tenue TaxID=586396 RepID=A0AAV0KAA2_9ROSI|nr:unnamed protein product [Linum tenue]
MERMADSEVSHSSDSFSLPSEPPDLRNWFSSYQYDSFVLDTCDDAFKSRGQKDPSIVDVADKIRANEDENLSERLETGECGEGSEAPESTYSPAFLNELNHPENWLSSYVSDSGGLDHDGELETPAIWESQGNEGAFIEEGINREPHFENSKEKSEVALEKPPSSDEVIANEFQYREGNEDSPLYNVWQLVSLILCFQNLNTLKTGFRAMYQTLVGWILMMNLRVLLFGKLKEVKMALSRNTVRLL